MTSPLLAKILGVGEEDRTPLEVVQGGLPYQAVEHLARALEMTLDELCLILPVSRRTLSRYRGVTLDRHLSDHVLMVGKVYERASEVMESAGNGLLWLKTPNYAFQNERPLDYLDTFTGMQEVLDELGRIQHGVFA